MNKIIFILVLLVLLVCFGFIFRNKIKEKIDNKRGKKEFENNIVLGNAGGVQYSLNPATTADEIYNALHRDCLFGLCENEQIAITALLNTPKAFISMVSDSYMKKYKLNLESDLVKLLDNENWVKVRELFQ